MRRIATMAAMTGALLMAPATASAAETAFVSDLGVLTYWSAAGQVDAVTVSDGTGANAGKHVLSETASPSVTVGTGCTSITSSSMACTGASAAFLAALDLDDTLTLDAALPGALWSGGGDDTATGGALNDWIYGEDGADVLEGRAGFDRIFGGAGNDRIEARDGEADYVDCGDGDDRAAVDPVDTVVGCEADALAPVQEAVAEPAAPAEGPDGVEATKAMEQADPLAPARIALPLNVELPPAGGTPAAVATVAPDGTAALALSCPVTETAGCAGVVFLDPAGAESRAKAKSKSKAKDKDKAKAMLSRRGRFGRSPFVVAAGKRSNVKIRLSPMARKALGLRPARRGKARAARRGRRVRARVTVVQKGRAARRSVVTLRG